MSVAGVGEIYALACKSIYNFDKIYIRISLMSPQKKTEETSDAGL